MALGDGIGRNKGVSHWCYQRKRDYVQGAEAMLRYLLSDSKFAACMLDTDNHVVINNVIDNDGLLKSQKIYSFEEVVQEFRKETKLEQF